MKTTNWQQLISSARTIGRYTFLSALGMIFIMPFMLAFLAGFKTDTEIFSFPPRIFPDGWTNNGRFEEQTLSENWRGSEFDEAGSIIVQQGETVTDGQLLATDNDGNEIHAIFDGTVTLQYILEARNDWQVLVESGDIVEEGQQVAIDHNGQSINASQRGEVVVRLLVPRRDDWQIQVKLRQELQTGDTIAIDENGTAIKATFPASVELISPENYENPSSEFLLNRVFVEGNYQPQFYALTDITSSERVAMPLQEVYGLEDIRNLQESPFKVQYERRVGWKARDQYGISNWINVFRTAESCNGFLGSYCFPYWLWNSTVIAALNVTTRVFFAVIAGYAFARLEFPGKNKIFTFMLATLMLPGAIILVPGFVLMADIGWVGTYWALVIPSMVEVFGIFLMAQFLKSIPKDLEEAARVDGATQWQIMWQVVLPLARPAIITLAIISFQGSWNEFLKAVLYLRETSTFTLPVGLQFLLQNFRQQWNLTLIGSMFNAVPVMIIFFIFNRYFVEGATYTGVKG